MFRKEKYRVGDHVVFSMPKHTNHPGPRAKHIEPENRGEEYSYSVDKYWIVDEVPDRDHVIAKTRRGKRHRLHIEDPRLRRARWWEKIVQSGRYPVTETNRQPSNRLGRLHGG